MAKTKTKPDRVMPTTPDPESLLEGVSAQELRAVISGEPAKTERIEMRVTAQEKEMIQQLADRCGVSVTKLLVALVESAASRVEA